MKSDGDDAEARALAHLQARGLKLITRNYRSRFGEIDLILDDAGTVVFVEVRKRAHSQFGGAAESIDRGKQDKLGAAARIYLATLPKTPPCRFDAVLVNGKGDIEWIKGAFEA